MIIYEEITQHEDSKEHVVIYEKDCILHYSQIIERKNGRHGGCFRPATAADHAIATLALVEQLNAKFTH